MTQLNLEYKTIQDLKEAYLPFIENGGLFVDSDQSFTIGTVVNVVITLPDGHAYNAFKSSIVWSAAKDVIQESHRPGFAIQIDGNQSKEIESKIRQLIESSE